MKYNNVYRFYDHRNGQHILNVKDLIYATSHDFHLEKNSKYYFLNK
jgi:hypothetical protein